ncbi:unnamed protein product [Medioppia subpectinata]|uniref:Major facilitator superfamily associated domain-containing protein n=1 Tax=Medioppia subpectinata TaxID=1979941 RepID=A0A7R9L7V3_9ACAR|nr:unnamed protein product [Medioppia subpectinata]CAG2116048.1 unnamed protein product [Medioppia subpectinata]
MIVMYFKLDLKTNESETNSEIVPNIVSDRKPLSVVLKAPFKASWKAVVHVFHIFRNNPSLIQYIVIVLIFGALTAFHWSYYFIYLEKIRGNDSLLMGLALFVESFAGELPLFIVANVILRYCGPSMSLNISLAAFAFRYFIYGYVFTVGTTYWDILLVEVVQGLTFGLFYTVMTDLAQHYATQENHRILAAREAIKEMADTEAVDETIAVNSVDDLTSRSYATLQGIMSGAFEGIGLGIGALAGGYLINRIDVFAIWKVGAFLALFAIIFNVSVETIKYVYNKRHVK